MITPNIALQAPLMRGTFNTLAAAKRHERTVQFFKRH
jgi:hypothetical protein